MAFPFTTIPGRHRDYYASALSRDPEQPTWSSGAQAIPNPYSGQLAQLGVVSLGIAGLVAGGFQPTTDGRNVFSKYYMPTLRGVEEYFPFRLTRTFQLSNFFSQFSTEAQASRTITGAYLSRSGTRAAAQRDYYSRITGRDLTTSLLEKEGGLVFHKGALYFGTGPEQLGERLLSNVSVILNKKGGAARLSEGIARAAGANLPFPESYWDEITGGSGVFARSTQYLDAAGKKQFAPFQIVGGNSPIQAATLQARGFGAAFVERFNLLSRSFPHDFIPDIIGKRIPPKLLKELHLGVTPGPAGKTLLKMAGKWGAVGGAAYFGYDLVDHLLNETVGIGPTKLAASTYVGARIGYASLGDITGLSAISREQEEMAPGSTNLLKLAGFPVLGGAAGLGIHYLERANLQAKLQRGIGDKVYDVEKASAVAERMLRQFGPGQPGAVNSIGRWLKDKEIFSQVFETKLFDRPWKVKGMIGAAIGLAAVAPFIPGALLPQTSAEELRDIYSGEKDVAIRRGRWWEMGRSPWEGKNIAYFRKHWYPLMMSDARDKSIYGEKRSALSKFFEANFTYNLEREHFYDRPYPITGTAFEDFPLIGPLLAATVGQFIKPALRMHEGEYMQDGEYLHQPLGFGERRAFELGESQPGTPISPYGTKGIIGEQAYRLQEMAGLWGYVPGAIKQAITGEEGFFTQEQQLESARRMYGVERNIWDRELGGGFGAGEILRRIFPHRRREIPLYNPIRNTMPDWLPGPGERSADFLHGDPYSKIPMGDVRLPGAGLEALYPELEGISPEDYSDVFKFKVLADVAPYSDQTRIYKSIVEGQRRGGELTEDETVMYEQSVSNLLALRNKKEFSEYAETWNPITKYWETITHGAQTPFEFLTPVSPASKMIHMQTAIEDYQNNILYGTENAFWNNPLKNFISPFIKMTAAGMGYAGVPGDVSETRSIEQYFDALKYIKLTRLKEIAEANRDTAAAVEFDKKRQETLIGVNPYTHTYAYIFRALPRRERDYFTAFSEEEDPEKRQQILSMLPANERNLFIARWKLARVEELKKEAKGSQLSTEAEQYVNSVYAEARQGGAPQSEELNQEYQATREDGENYGDWYRRTKLLPAALDGRPVPGPDWVGFHPAVDLDDIKLKLVTNIGLDMHDFDLWPSDQTNLARRPFINDQAIREIDPDSSMSEGEIRQRLRDLLNANNMENVDISIAMFPSDKTSYNVDLDITHDRSEEIRRVHERGI